MTDAAMTPSYSPAAPASNLHAALMHAGMTAEQADGVARAIEEYIDTLVGGHWINQAPKPKKKKQKKTKAKKRKR